MLQTRCALVTGVQTCALPISTVPGAELSRTGTLAGSLPYMAPERHQGVEAGAGGDVYAAGCLLWFALTGAAPYAGTDVEMAMAHLQAPIPLGSAACRGRVGQYG